MDRIRTFEIIYYSDDNFVSCEQVIAPSILRIEHDADVTCLNMSHIDGTEWTFNCRELSDY